MTVRDRGEPKRSDPDSEALSHPGRAPARTAVRARKLANPPDLRTKIEIETAPAYTHALVPYSSPVVTPFGPRSPLTCTFSQTAQHRPRPTFISQPLHPFHLTAEVIW
ncbi:hypothetical protein K488DRAFT_87580 [Vararia minispora EC-137]|uniref:Uncharacterized protein n=1 Tax=Vararia minispora EC-137 TaxID=1314806 RepID=A0ACB8QG94_9AGAM|nr:hypothetical protein K488DRAFT_87580 [Vararia minispora EC-137]